MMRKGVPFTGIPLTEWLTHSSGYHEIAESILSALDAASLVKLGATCRVLRERVRQLWNIDAVLGRFVADPIGFRRLMQRTDAVIGGSVALQFFLRERFRDSDLDVYVPNGVLHLDMVQSYLVDFERYKLEECESPEEMEDEFDYSIVDLRKKVCGQWLKIQLIRTRDIRYGSPIQRILEYYGSHVMNFLTWHTAYCLFPRSTLLERSICLMRRSNFSEICSLQKYAGRGFRLLEKYGSSELVECRRVGDRFTFGLPFSMDDEAAEKENRLLIDQDIYDYRWIITKEGLEFLPSIGYTHPLFGHLKQHLLSAQYYSPSMVEELVGSEETELHGDKTDEAESDGFEPLDGMEE
jgi:hypothetical protein